MREVILCQCLQTLTTRFQYLEGIHALQDGMAQQDGRYVELNRLFTNPRAWEDFVEVPVYNHNGKNGRNRRKVAFV